MSCLSDSGNFSHLPLKFVMVAGVKWTVVDICLETNEETFEADDLNIVYLDILKEKLLMFKEKKW